VGRMVRTNIVIDEDLVTMVMQIYGLESKREAVDFALKRAIGKEETIDDPWKGALELRGMWADMTDEQVREIWGEEAPDSDEELGR
jgi:Arc/MetJ family transcription regulator